MAAPIIPAVIIDGLPVGGNGVLVGLRIVPPFVCVCVKIGLIFDALFIIGVGVKITVGEGETFFIGVIFAVGVGVIFDFDIGVGVGVGVPEITAGRTCCPAA